MKAYKRALLVTSLLGTLLYLIKLIWSKRRISSIESSGNELAQLPDDIAEMEHDSEYDYFGNDGPLVSYSRQWVKNGMAIMNSRDSTIENNLHIHLIPYDRIKEEMKIIADYLKMSYRMAPLQERNMEFHLLDSTHPSICSVQNVEGIFQTATQNATPPRRILIVDEQKVIGKHLAYMWGTVVHGFICNFAIVYLVTNTSHESTTIQSEIIKLCGITGTELEENEIFKATRRYRQQALIIIEDLEAMDHSTRQNLSELFDIQNLENSQASYLRLATFVVVSSSAPVQGLEFDKILIRCPSMLQSLM